MATLKDRLNVPEYKQWMKGGLVLKHLQAGIADYLDDEVRALHGKILNDVKATLTAGVAVQCVACNNTTARSRGWTCPCHKICSDIKKQLEIQHARGPGKLTMVNTDVSQWTDTNKHWEIGKCYCSPGYSDKRTVKEIDCSGLLGLISNCKVIKQKVSRTLTQPDNVFEEVRAIRNKKIMHSADLTLQVVDLDELVRKSLKILQTQSSVLKNDATNAAKIKNNDLRDALLRKASSMDDAERKIVEIRDTEITITLEDELEALSNKVESLRVSHVQLEERVEQQIQDHKTAVQKEIEELKSNEESLEEKVKTDMDSTKKDIRDIDIALQKVNNCITSNNERTETIKLEMEKIRKKNENLSAIIEEHHRWMESEIQKINQRLQEHEKRLQELEQLNENKEAISQEGMKSLQKCLIKIYEDLTEIIPLSPFGRDEGLPIQQLYTPVIVEEDLSKWRNHSDNKQVTSYHDLLYQGNELVKQVYMIGSTGRGKSTYCLRMLDDWINSRNEHDRGNNLSDGEKDMLEFEFVFFVSLRHVDKLLTSVFEMICSELLCEHPQYRNTVIHAFESMPKKCLVIVDGLDEWSPTSGVCSKLRNPGLPNRDNLNGCPVFMTSRPWKLEMLRPMLHQSDKLTNIKGIDKDGVKQLVKKVLNHHCGITEESEEMLQKSNDFLEKSGNRRFEGLLQIPLIVTFLVSVWHDFGTLSDSLVQLYLSIIKCLVQKVDPELDTTTIEPISGTSDYQFCKMDDYLLKYFPLFQSLGKIAFKSLIDTETTLVFPRDELEKNIDKSNLELSLKIGLICQSKFPGKKTQKYVSLSFFHESMQEFLAAIWLVSDKNSVDHFLNHCSSTNTTLAVSNIFYFVSGLDPEKCRKLCDHISHLSNLEFKRVLGEIMSDKYISWLEHWNRKSIYELQVGCYRECVRYTGSLVKHTVLHAAVDDRNLDISTGIFKVNQCCMKSVSMYIFSENFHKIVPEIKELKTLQYLDMRSDLNNTLDMCLENNHELKIIQMSGVDINTIYLPVESLQILILNNVKMPLESFQQLSRCTQLTDISIYMFLPLGSSIGSGDICISSGDIYLSNSHKLQTIDLKYMKIQNILLPVENLQKLTLLDIDMSSECELSQQLSRCSQLTDISIGMFYPLGSYTSSGDIDLSNSQKLQTLKLTDMKIPNIHLPLNYKLQTIVLINMNIPNIHLPFRSLQKLTLKGLDMSSECGLLQQLSRCTELKYISVSVSSEGPSTCTCDIDLSKNNKLQTIDLENMNIQNILLPVESLQKLALDEINMSWECELLQQVSRCTQLTDFSISICFLLEPYTCTGDIDLSNNDQLETIELKHMYIQNILLPVESLQKLTLCGMKISPECELSQQLLQCPKLSHLILKGIHKDTLQVLFPVIPCLTQLVELKIQGEVTEDTLLKFSPGMTIGAGVWIQISSIDVFRMAHVCKISH